MHEENLRDTVEGFLESDGKQVLPTCTLTETAQATSATLSEAVLLDHIYTFSVLP